MSKSNVNPNHYKVAGRERQGEDILQERHKQTHAESLAEARIGPPGQAADAASPGQVTKQATKRAAKKAAPKSGAKGKS
jgi:hypothetical protein